MGSDMLRITAESTATASPTSTQLEQWKNGIYKGLLGWTTDRPIEYNPRLELDS